MKFSARKLVLAVFLCASLFLWSEELNIASFEKRIQVRTLPNGLTVLLLQRKEAPVFSFYTFVDAGASQDPKGKTGLAHMFEHMAFKGTDKIGTKDYAAEKEVLQKIEVAYAAYIAERDKRVDRNEQKVQQLEQRWKQLVDQAEQYVVRNQFGQIIEENGGVGMNASTSQDETVYFYSMPANRLELWAYLEASRFLHPVMREFYKERDVVYEERRTRVESNPIGRLVEQFTSTAFQAHPYRNPGIGWPSDLQSFSASDAMNFFQTYYVPSNMTLAVVGDIDSNSTWPIIEKYFDRLPTKPKPDERTTAEPPQKSVREVEMREVAQPIYVEGYHRPDYRSPDDAVFDAITDLMSSGRTSRLYRSLVRDKRIAAVSAGFSGMPGYKYPHLFAFYAVPIPGHTPEEMRDAIHQEIERLKTTDVSDTELNMIKTRAKAGLIRGLGSNSGLAAQLALYQARYGDWRELFRQVDRIDKVSKQDIRRVSNATFVDSNRTTAVIHTVPPPAPPGAEQQQQPQRPPKK